MYTESFHPCRKRFRRTVAVVNDEIPDDYMYSLTDGIVQICFHSGVGIHHPSGDYMKISTYGNYPTEFDYTA